MHRHTVSLVAAGLLGSVLSGCGIDQGGSPAPATPAAAAVVLLGPITDFGSIEVNGAFLDTSGAMILVDGLPAAQADLRLGQVVRVVAGIDGINDAAVVVDYQESVRGLIAQLDAVAGTLTVLEQAVRTDANTRFDLTAGGALADLSLGDRVEISGLKDPAGGLLASYIGTAVPTTALEVSTAITAVDLSAQTFELGALSVDYSQTLVLQLPGGAPEVGLVVEVEGLNLSPGGALIADQILTLPADPGVFSAVDTVATDADLAMIGAPLSASLDTNFAGFITDTTVSNTIALGDVQLTLTAGTVVVGGTVNDLQAGQLVQVEGQVTSVGEVQANRITIL